MMQGRRLLRELWLANRVRSEFVVVVNIKLEVLVVRSLGWKFETKEAEGWLLAVHDEARLNPCLCTDQE